MTDYYVYAYLDPRKPGDYSFGEYSFNEQPFYIGCGRKDRLHHHLREVRYKGHPSHKKNTIKAILDTGKSPTIIKLRENLTKESSRTLEILLIKTIGRADQGLGPLCNHTDGGDGLHNPDTITRNRIGNRPYNRGADNYFFGKNVWTDGTRGPLTDATRQKLREIMINRKMPGHTDEWKQAHSARMTGSGNPAFGKTGALNPRYGSHHSTETLQKMSEARKKYLNSKKPVIWDGKEYTSYKACAEALGVSYSTIRRWVNQSAQSSTE